MLASSKSEIRIKWNLKLRKVEEKCHAEELRVKMHDVRLHQILHIPGDREIESRTIEIENRAKSW